MAACQRLAPALLAAALLTASLLAAAPAPADTAPYTTARTERSEEPDPLPGLGGATTAATADNATGYLSASAVAAEGFPVRTGTPVGRSSAKATAVIGHALAAAPGRWEIAATLSFGPPAAQASAALPVVTKADASVVASLGAISRVCPAGPASCSPTYAPGTQALLRKKLACAPATGGCGAGSPLELRVAVDAPSPGDIFVEVTLEASATAEGMASASAGGAATVAGISVAPASPPNPFTPPVPLSPRVPVDALTVDARGIQAVSHVPLPATKAFLIEARGPYRYTEANDLADAECAQAGGRWTSDPIPSQPDALDLLVNGQAVPWAPEFGSARVEAAGCSVTHTYQVAMVGPGDTLTFRVQDPTPLDNRGAIVVAIYMLVP